MRLLSPSTFGVFALSCTLTWWGCASISPAHDDATTPAIVGTGAKTSQPVTSAGGSVTLEGTTITIPPGALGGNQTISIESTTNAPPTGVTNFSPIYQFGPAGLVFRKPVTIQLQFTGNGHSPAFAWTNPGSAAFGILPSAVTGTTLSAQITHFSQGFVADSFTVAALPAGTDDGGASDATLPGEDGSSPPCNVCSSGFCESACPSGTTTCGSSTTCVSTDTDPANCGGCGNACSSGQTCAAGTCVTSCYSQTIASACSSGIPLDGGGVDCTPCGSSFTACGSQCTSTSTDPSNCGSCGSGCAPGQTCSSGVCTAVCPGTDVCAGRACVSACPSGQTVCDAIASGATGFCTSTQTDAFNCGSCGTACAAGLQCVAGACVASCVGPFTTSPGTATTLDDGGIMCTSPFTACDQQCINLASDPFNCGGCGAFCAVGQLCSNGACTPICSGSNVCTVGGTCATSCPSGQSACNVLGSTATSTCNDLANDPANCGACGQQCPANQGCSGGSCIATCK